MRPVLGMAGAVLTVGVLAGCATAQPGSAAVVGDEQISQSVVGEQMTALNVVLGQDPDTPSEDLARGIVIQEVTGELIVQTAERLEVSVPPARVDQVLQAETDRLGGLETLQNTAAQAFVPPERVKTFLMTRLLFSAVADKLAPDASPDARTQLAIQAVVETGEQVGVLVAPRYGEWSAAQLQIVPPADPVSKTADDPANAFSELQVPQPQ